MATKPTFLAQLPPQGRRIVTFCPVCDKQSSRMGVAVIEETEHIHLLHLECHYCRHSLVSLVMTDEHMVSAMAVLTDCTAADVERFRTAPSINADNVIDFDTTLDDNGLAGIVDLDSSNV